ncbi:MAG: hypothetical protein N4A72_15990 [Bacteroidales bacterium]|jgi:hypothetical protein|nr:hypothetical protein [Bacteroidales bacterium]
MENNNTEKLDEDIRQHKLYKIQVNEQKIREYKNVFNTIKESTIVKNSKNISSYIVRFIFRLITILLIIIGISFLFPENVIGFIESNGKVISETDKSDLKDVIPYIGYICIVTSTLFILIIILLKKNAKKRNTIHKLSKLVSEVIEYIETDTKEEKIKYEYFVDSMAETEYRKKSNENNSI